MKLKPDELPSESWTCIWTSGGLAVPKPICKFTRHVSPHAGNHVMAQFWCWKVAKNSPLMKSKTHFFVTWQTGDHRISGGKGKGTRSWLNLERKFLVNISDQKTKPVLTVRSCFGPVGSCPVCLSDARVVISSATWVAPHWLRDPKKWLILHFWPITRWVARLWEKKLWVPQSESFLEFSRSTTRHTNQRDTF